MVEDYGYDGACNQRSRRTGRETLARFSPSFTVPDRHVAVRTCRDSH